AFVHDAEAQKVLSQDGVDRLVARGPDKLTVDGEMSSTLTREDVIEKELESFRDLVGAINFFGIQKNI
ncbi:MAG: methanogenesis-associated radical SAM protein, partial [Methanobacteriaceae archaeon]|nr:methanogenesis-associated radical SAM protein [Methanobacteriaceae archaeon]